ncbi:hypothetical protein NTD86_19385 [Pseudomonas sp. 7P_10.2_Bac1]|uniref:dermonecrotic toxin domain-containing protein n=1 Tax=Pseudomonas sp. 7P_10.2_Bac1 TaxID=2971614 RepID=UPI0021C8288E|nr:DUF6543 domain-containing protein [Pseudomonas sp. 7P_10.2_Bac1]MCU1729142.1 hypothetical protein [Pseudomonas sp. 7P_10.2_Bac1]
MKTLSSTPDFLARFTAIGNFPQDQFLPRPTFEGAVAAAFKQAMLEASPALQADFTQLHIAQCVSLTDPQPAQQADQIDTWQLIVPSKMLIQGFIDQRTINLSADRHRLTVDQKPDNPAPLSVRMDTLEGVLNEWAPQVIDVFAQALTHFWSTPSALGVSPWLWLVRVLQVGLSAAFNNSNRQPALTQEQAAGLGALAAFAEKNERLRLTTETPLHAYLINIETTQAQGPQYIQFPGLALITRRIGERLIVMAWSLTEGIEAFDSLQDFAQSLPRRIPGLPADSPLVWSLYEPEGHFFQALAQTLLDQTLRTLVTLGQTARTERWSASRLAQALDKEAAMFQFFSPEESPGFQQLVSKVPPWLTAASPADLRDYSRLMAAQVVQQHMALGKTFLDDIPPLLDFAVQTLNARMLQDHPDEHVDAARIEIHDIAIQNLQMAWLTEDVLSLAEFSLTYVGGKPAAFIGVKELSDLPLPTWLNASYLKNLLENIDIGALYINLLKAKLVDDVAQVTSRKALFTFQLKAQLPLLALEHKIRGTGGFTEAGWKLVARLMGATSVPLNNGQDCIRPLAFTLYEGAAVNLVDNMFVLGPRDLSSGPLVLYRPFATDSLLEFADREALMTAIKQPGELQDLVLAWLPDSMRSYYADGGFERPHLESVVNAGLLALLPRSPAQLADLIIKGDALAYVFDSHVQALITLSDKQSVSGSERRWLMFKRYAWMLFNGLTFFVNGPLQKAAWIFQTLISIDEALQARIEGDQQAAKESVINLLLNLGQALLNEGLSFHAEQNAHSRLKAPHDLPMLAPLKLPAEPTPETAPASETPRALSRKAGPDPDALAIRSYSTLDFSWFSAQSRPSPSQRAALDTFITPLDVSGGARIEVAPLKGLINFQGHTYAVILEKTYRVSRQDDGVVIQDAIRPLRFGPWLMSDEAGQWDFDLRLKLRGGGPKKRIAQLREEKKQALMQLVAEEARLMTEKQTRDRVLTLTEHLLATPSGREATFFERYETEFIQWRSSARALINVLEKMNELVPVPAFANKMQALWVELTFKLFKMQNFLEEQRKDLPLTTFSEQFKIQLGIAINQLETGNQRPYLQIIEHLKKAEVLERKAFDIALMEAEGIEETSKLPLPRDSPLADLFQKKDKHFFDRHWSVIYMETLLELVLNRTASDLTAEELHAFKQLDTDAFVNMGWSQLRLRLQPQITEEHIEFFESAIALYQSLTATCENLIALNSEHFRNEYLPSLKAVVKPLQAFAELQLSKVIWESESSSSESDEPQPGPSWKAALPQTKAKAGTSRQKVFKTTGKQVLVGVVREPSPDNPTEIVDVVDAFSQLTVSSYRRATGDEWEPIENVRPANPAPVSHAKSLVRLETDAAKLLDRVETSIQQARAFAKTSKIPVEIEEILEFKSQSLDEVAEQMQRLLLAQGPDVEPLSRSRISAANGLIAQLELNSVRLRTEGKRLRISLITDLPPTAAHIDYLKAQDQVEIVRLGRRRPLSGPRKDYMQEYEIRSRDGKALWYAHFHYDSTDAPLTSFTAAHLKTEEQRFLSAQALYAQAGSTTDVIQIYRSKITLALAEKLFLAVQ